jgi:adenosylhomocysteine nucleosidase
VSVDLIVQVAMSEEAQPFLDMADSVSAEDAVGGASFRTLAVGTPSIALVTSGIGTVNAAHAATVAVSRYGTDVPIVSAGTAGGLAANITVGTVVIAADVINLDADVRAFGYALGQVPRMPETYVSDAALADRLFAADQEFPVVRGRIGSGEKFATSDIALKLREDFPSVIAVDMESVAIAQIAFKYGNPFVAVRAISDLCAPDGTEFLTHVDDAALRSARTTKTLLERH